MTLIEVLVALVIVGLMLGGIGYGFSAVTRADLRRAAGDVAGSIRFLWAEAASTGRAHRLVIDLERATITAEVAEGTVLLKDRDRTYGPTDENPEDPIAGDTGDEDDEGGAGAAGAAGGLGALPPGAAEAMESMGLSSDLGALGGLLGGGLGGPGVGAGGRAPRLPKPTFAAFEGHTALRTHNLPRSVTVSFVFAEHMEEPKREGAAELYFWPGGMTERAIVELRTGDTIYTVYVPPVTGKAKVIAGEMAVPTDMRRYEALDEEVVE